MNFKNRIYGFYMVVVRYRKKYFFYRLKSLTMFAGCAVSGTRHLDGTNYTSPKVTTQIPLTNWIKITSLK